MSESSYADRLVRDLGREVIALLGDDDVTEIGSDPFSSSVWKDSRSAGGKRPTEVSLPKANLHAFLNRTASFNTALLTAATPCIECALPEDHFHGARLTGHIPPIVAAPGFRIRKLPQEAYPLENYLSWGTFTRQQFDYVVECIAAHRNIAVVGGTGTGKTTLAMSILRKAGELAPHESILTIEQVPELRVTHSWCWYPFYTAGDLGYSYLLERALRASPDRIVIGESRGQSLLQLFDAFLSGHDGGVFTFHSSSVEKALRRMYIYCTRASSTSSHRFTIGDAVDLMIVLERTGEVRRAKEVARIHGYTESGGYHVEHVT